jgi:hypothetical protein
MMHLCGGPPAGVAPQIESLRQLISQSAASADDRHARIRPAIRPPAAPKIKITKQSQFLFAALVIHRLHRLHRWKAERLKAVSQMC